VACGIVEREFGCALCLFLQGAAGDINPLRNTSNFDDVRRYGLALGGAALAALAHLSAPGPIEQPALAAACAEVALPVRELPPREPAERALAEALAAVEAAEDEEERRRRAGRAKQAREVLNLLDLGPDPIRAPLQA